MNYQELKDAFSWESVMETYDWTVLEKFNMGHECCDRWAEDPKRVAIYWEDESGKKRSVDLSKIKRTIKSDG